VATADTTDDGEAAQAEAALRRSDWGHPAGRSRAEQAADRVAGAAAAAAPGTRLGTKEEVRAQCGVSVGTVSWANFEEASPIGARAFVVQRRPGPLVLVKSLAVLGRKEKLLVWPLSMLFRRHVVLNARHALVARLTDVWRTEPGYATYQLAKLLCMADGIHPTVDARLATRALHQAGSTDPAHA